MSSDLSGSYCNTVGSGGYDKCLSFSNVAPINTDVWSHIAVTKSSYTVKFYFNGTFLNQALHKTSTIAYEMGSTHRFIGAGDDF